MIDQDAVWTVADFRLLDEGDVLEGYLDGFHGGDAPDEAKSRSYRHGWRNGAVESGRIKPDAAYVALAAEFELFARKGTLIECENRRRPRGPAPARRRASRSG